MNKLGIENKNTTLYVNVRQDVIVLDANNLKLRLMTFHSNVTKMRGWVAPASILITILIALVTTTFRDFLGFSAELWEFIFIGIGMFCFLAVLFQGHTYSQVKKKCSVDYFIEELKNASEKIDNHEH